MRLHRFFIDDPLSSLTIITTDNRIVHQIKNVLRFEKDDELLLFNGKGIEAHAKIITLDKKSLGFSIISKSKHSPSKTEINLYQSIIKKDNFEWVTQKATELGISQIIPVLSERSEKKDLNFERLNTIIIEACEQSGRQFIPQILPIQKFDKAITVSKGASYICDFSGNKIANISTSETINLFIGPEGGYSKNEIDLVTKHGFFIVNLNPNTLRAETAAIAALSIFTYIKG